MVRLDPSTKPLTRAEMALRLAGLPSSVAGEMFAFVQKLSDIEASRQQRLDAKATALSTAVGLSLTVAFTFGAFLLKEGKNVWGPGLHTAVVVFFVVALLAAVGSAFFAIRALLVTQYAAIGEDTVFNEAILNNVRAERDEVESTVPEIEPGKRDPSARDQGEAAALAQYHMSMIMALWFPVMKQRENHSRKARQVKLGQWCFGGFLFAIIVLFFFLALAAYPS